MTRQRWTLIALLLILLLAAGLRLYRLDAQSLWYDEGASASYTLRSPGDIWRHTAADIHPPGYYLLLSGWVRPFGTSEPALRGLSVLFGVLLVAQVYSLGRALFNPTVGLLAGALIAIDPFHVYYSQEVRMYTLLASLGAASMWLFIQWLAALNQPAARRRRAWLLLAGLVLVNAAGLYTHYIYPLFIGVEMLLFLAWWLWDAPAGARRRAGVLGAWAGAQLVTVLIYLPWLPIAVGNLAGTSGSELPFSPGEGLLEMASVLAYGITLPVEAAVIGLVPLGILVLVGLLPPFDGGTPAHPSHGWRVGLLLTWTLIPVSALFLFRVYQAGYLNALLPEGVAPNAGAGSFTDEALRFLLPADFALALLLARGFWMGLHITRADVPGLAQSGWLPLVVVVLAAFGLAPSLEALHNLYFDPAYARDDYRGLTRHLQEAVGPDDSIILDGPGQVETFTYYYPSDEAIYPLPAGDTEAQLEEILARPGRVYAVFYGEDARDPQRIVEGTLDARAFEAETRWYGDVRLVTYGVSSTVADAPAVPLDAQFGESVRLLGYSLDAADALPGGHLSVALFWETDAPLDESYSVFVHLVGAEDAPPLAQHDGAPGGGTSFTNTWSPGQTVSDHHGVLIPQDIPPGEYALTVGMYVPGSGERLPVTLDGAAVGDRLLLSTLSVK